MPDPDRDAEPDAEPRVAGFASDDRLAAWQGVPCVDLGVLRSDAVDMPAAREVFRSAFERFGFVRLSGHGVPASLLTRVDLAFRRFFDRPEAEKLGCSNVAGGQRGYTAYGVEHARDRTRADLKSFYHVGQPDPLGPAAAEYPRNIFPDDDPDLATVALELYAALEQASVAVLEGIETVFEIPKSALSELIHGGNSILRALDYPAISPEALAIEEGAGDRDGRALRAAPHEDINLITLLPASSEDGLEIWLPGPGEAGGRWLPVMAHPGELVVDVGDMLARLTGGRLPATTHRVVVDAHTAQRRRSAYPFFAHPRPECDLSVRGEFLEPGEAPALPAITAGAFLRERLVEIGLLEED